MLKNKEPGGDNLSSSFELHGMDLDFDTDEAQPKTNFLTLSKKGLICDLTHFSFLSS